MDLEFIDISQGGEERRSSRNRNYVGGSAVRAERPTQRGDYGQRRPASESRQRRNSAGGSQRSGNVRRRTSTGQIQRTPEEIERRRRRTSEEVERRRRKTPEEIEQRRQRILKKRKLQRRRRMVRGIILVCEMAFIILLCLLLYQFIRSFQNPSKEPVMQQEREQEVSKVIEENKTQKPMITEDFLTVNPYSRPGEKLETVNNIFVHYTANKGTSAAQNRSYFENLGITGETSASAHFIIGSEGEIIQCIPLDEIAYAVMKRNYDSVSIECCYLDDDGEFTYATYMSLIRLCAWLLNEYNLSPDDILRHYDEGGKKCPLYYVEHEGEWERFKQEVGEYILKEPTV